MQRQYLQHPLILELKNHIHGITIDHDRKNLYTHIITDLAWSCLNLILIQMLILTTSSILLLISLNMNVIVSKIQTKNDFLYQKENMSAHTAAISKIA